MAKLTPLEKAQKVEAVIHSILEGKPLTQAAKEVDLSPWQFYRLLQGDRESAQAYARAIEIKADIHADEVVTLADGDGDPAKVRNQIQARQWWTSKRHSKSYGDRVEMNVTQTIDIGSTLAEARARLRPVSDQHNIVDAQVVDITTSNSSGLTDKQSLTTNIEPDIFS